MFVCNVEELKFRGVWLGELGLTKDMLSCDGTRTRNNKARTKNIGAWNEEKSAMRERVTTDNIATRSSKAENRAIFVKNVYL